MKAIRIHQTGDLDVIQCDTVPKPEVGADQVLIKTEVAGVNFIDTYFRSGLYPVSFPFTLGQECGGKIGEVGANVKDLEVGDRVVALVSGAFAERVVVDRARVIKVPRELSVREVTSVLTQGLTAITLTHTSYAVQKGDFVFVHAIAGGTGLLLTQVAKSLGAHVIGTTSTEAKAQLAKKVGADDVFLYDDDYVARVHEITGGQGVHVVYDSVGQATFDSDFELVRRLGTIVSFGQSSGVPEPVRLLRLTPKNVALLRPQLYNYLTTPEEFAQYTQILLDLLQRDVIRISIYREYLFSTEGVQQAQRDLTSRKTTGKLMLRIPPTRDD